jgi:hypothetical protein
MTSCRATRSLRLGQSCQGQPSRRAVRMPSDAERAAGSAAHGRVRVRLAQAQQPGRDHLVPRPCLCPAPHDNQARSTGGSGGGAEVGRAWSRLWRWGAGASGHRGWRGVKGEKRRQESGRIQRTRATEFNGLGRAHQDRRVAVLGANTDRGRGPRGAGRHAWRRLDSDAGRGGPQGDWWRMGLSTVVSAYRIPFVRISKPIHLSVTGGAGRDTWREERASGNRCDTWRRLSGGGRGRGGGGGW